VSERVLIDTSAIFAFLVADDVAHGEALRLMGVLRERGARLITTSYVLVESYALVGRRVGPDGIAALRDALAPLIEVVWINRVRHDRALDRLQEAGTRRLSLVDCSCFVVCEELGIETAFAFDRHFERAGLKLLG